MSKRLGVLLCGICLLLSMAGCSINAHTTMSYTYNVETGDQIKISLDTSDKYKLSSDLPFTISCDGDTLSQGTFITKDGFNQYKDLVHTEDGITLLDSGTKDGNEYIFWSYKDAEYNYAVLVKDSSTGVLIGNPVSTKSAKECFRRMDISKE